jgi:lon-related putative ATP-dependent protease
MQELASARGVESLEPKALRRRCEARLLPFETTAELEDLTEVIGQPRVVEAMHFGLRIQRKGYNIFSLGPEGLGKHSILRTFLDQEAAAKPAPPDWCYVDNFVEPEKPRALQLPAGQGAALRRDLDHLVEELRSAIPGAFESEDYRARKEAIEEEIKSRAEKAFDELREDASKKSIALIRTPRGLMFAPVREGDPLGPEEFSQLPEKERQRIDAELTALQGRLEQVIHQVPKIEREGRERLRELNRDVTILAVGHLMEEVREKYKSLPDVVAYLNDVQQDVVENVAEFLKPPEPSLAALLEAQSPRMAGGPLFFRRYQVNVLVDHATEQGAPIVQEEHPTYANLVGRFEYVAHLGALVTDFNLIRPGALHRANGGYLMLDAFKVLLQPLTWEGLKRALRSGEIRIEPAGQMLGLASAVSLEPEPIPLDVKVVLVGDRLLYSLLCQYDPEFHELFKVAADFEEQMERSPENDILYARLIATLARQEKLIPFDRAAVARLIEESSRLAGDAEKLSTRRMALADWLREADFLAREAGHAVVSAADVARAIDAQIHRADRVRERLREEIQRGTIVVETGGEKVGEVNGLSVIELGQFVFGRPSRISARVRLGRGEVVDIEREVELGGPIHSKGVLILAGFLGGRYAADRPLSVSASLVFEQSYTGVEGDSASLAELCALLSALAGAPVKQALAVTGSVSQHGQVQAVGAVNEKIEGFFDLCRTRGLTGAQGVIIPAANTKHLMLREEVVEAVAAGKFQIYPVETVDEAMELLTGLPAGEHTAAGAFPPGSINQRVEAKLLELAEKRQQLLRATEPARNGE